LNLALCKDLASFVVLPDDNLNECYKTGDKFEVQESYDYQIMKNTGCLATIGYAFRRGGHQVWLILAYKKPIPFIYSVGKSF
jgi:hypothetical protein